MQPFPRSRATRALRLLTAAATGVFAASVQAAPDNVSLTAPGTYFWSGLPWSAGVPAAGDDAILSDTAPGSVTIIANTNYTSATRLGNITENATSSSFNFIQSSVDLFAHNFTLDTVGTASYTQTAGILDLSSTLILAKSPNSAASYILSGGVMNADTEYVGQGGSGSFFQSGGANTVSTLRIADNSGATGIYSLYGSGTLAATSITVKSNGTFTQSAGTLSFNTFTQTGGSVSLPSLSLPASTNAYFLSGGTLTIGTLDIAANPSRFHWTAGTLSLTSDLNIDSGQLPFGSSFTLNQDKSLQAINLFIGITGSGSITQSKGNISTTSFFALAVNPGSTASYSLSGGNLTTPESDISDSGIASFSQTGGSHSTNSFYVAVNAGSTGTYSLSAGSLLSDYSYIGYSGAASFSQSGGTHSVTQGFDIGYFPHSSGAYSLSAGSLSLDLASIGYYGDATFSQSGGTNTISGTFILAVAPGSIAIYSLSAGTLSSLHNSYFGLNGAATISQTGGTFFTPNLALALDPGSYASYSLSAGSLSVSGAVEIGGDSGTIGGIGILSISGTASASFAGALTLFNSPGSSISLAGGSLAVTSLNLSSHPEHFSWTGGNLTFNNGYTIDSNFALGSSLLIPAGSALSSPSPSTNAGSILLSTGSSLAGAGTLTNNGLIAGAGTISAPLLNPAAGTLLVPANATLSITQGLSTNSGAITLAGGTFDNNFHPLHNTGLISGHGSLNISALISNGSISVLGGALSVSGPLVGTGSVFVDSSSSLDAPGGLTQSLLTLLGSVTVGADSSLATLSFPTSAGSFDIADHSLTLTATPLDTVRQYLSTKQLHGFASSVQGLSYTGTSTITIVETFFGDINLNGKVDADDYALIDRSFAKHITDAHWTDGDFNYDGLVTSADYLLMDRAFLVQNEVVEPTLLAEREAQFGDIYVTQLLASLPEPSLLFAACGLALFSPGRNRRHSQPSL